MKTTLLATLALLVGTVIGFIAAPGHAAAARAPETAADSHVFELRTYHAAPGKIDALHARFRDHTTALFKNHGMRVVGYWVPTDAEQGSADTLIYILEHDNRAAAKASWAAFGADPEWVKARTESEKDGRLTTKVESVFMAATDYSPMK